MNNQPTQIAAICKALLAGDILSIMTGFQKFACTNLPREISRSVEQKFGVKVSKERVEFTSQYGRKGSYFRYRLNRTDYNSDGIIKMTKYLLEHDNSILAAGGKTDKENGFKTKFEQHNLFY